MKFKEIASKITANTSITEIFILLLVVVGLPSISYIYFDWRASYATLIINLIIICTMRLRYGGN